MVRGVFKIPIGNFSQPADAPLGISGGSPSAALPENCFWGGDENRLIALMIDHLLGGKKGGKNTAAISFASHSVSGSLAKSLEPLESSSPLKPHPYLLVGSSGTGKSLLCHCIANHWNEPKPVFFVSGADWCRGFAQRDGEKINQFREECLNASLLIIDGLDQLAGNPAAQTALCQMIDEFDAALKPIVLTSQQMPGSLPIGDRLNSRVSGGLIVRVQPPSQPVRQELMRGLFALRGLQITPSAAHWLSEQTGGTVPEIRNIVFQCLARSTANPPRKQDRTNRAAQPTAASVIDSKQMQSLYHDWQRKDQLTIPNIIAATARFLKLPQQDIIGSSRKRYLVEARGIAMYLAREMTNQPLKSIGFAFGGRDHTTVLHAIKRIQEESNQDADLQLMISEVKRRINSLR